MAFASRKATPRRPPRRRETKPRMRRRVIFPARKAEIPDSPRGRFRGEGKKERSRRDQPFGRRGEFRCPEAQSFLFQELVANNPSCLFQVKPLLASIGLDILPFYHQGIAKPVGQAADKRLIITGRDP